MDAPPFDSGARSPGIGMLVLAIEPKVLDPDYPTRVDDFVARLSDDWCVDVSRFEDAAPTTRCRVESQLFERLERAATSGTSCQVSAT
jgi:(2R)-3-sulfolactate dehydrogenase (NADP+)